MRMSGVHVVISLMLSSNRFESGLCSNLSLAFSYPIRRNLAFEGSPSRVPWKDFWDDRRSVPSDIDDPFSPTSFFLTTTLHSAQLQHLFELQAPPLLAFAL
jgi:hypothetical protein